MDSTESAVARSKEAKFIADIQQDSALHQLVHKPTRGSNTLDLLFTNVGDMIKDVRVIDGIIGSDHDAIQFDVNTVRLHISRHKRYSYSFKKADFTLFRTILSNIPWDCCFLNNNVEESWIKFKDILFSVADQCIPKIVLHRRKRTNWLSDETLKLIRKKKRLYKRVKCSGEERDFRRYRSVSNIVRGLTRKDHYIHPEEISLDLHKNQRAFWRWIKNIREAKLSISHLTYRNKVLVNAVDKAKALNTYFCSIFTREDNSMLTKLRDELMDLWSNMSIYEISFTEHEVYDINKACGPDEIPGRLLKEGAAWLMEPISKLFTMSMQTGELPKD